MPRIGDLFVSDDQSSARNTTQFSDSKSLWRNHVRLRHNEEFAVIKFLQDCDDGDKTLFHSVPSVSSSGKTFTSYEFCSDAAANNVEGRVFEEPCIHCANPDLNDENGRPQLRNRFRYYVMHYGTYHLESNPYIKEQREWTQDWKSVEVGRQVYFRETKLQPQILELSPGTWTDLSDDFKRRGTILDKVYEYRRSFREGQVRYKLVASDIKVPNFDEQLATIAADFPPMIEISAQKITEIDFPVLESAAKKKEQEVEDGAFEKMANFEEEF